MNAFWSYFWPPFGAGVAVAIIAGAIAFRRRRRRYVALGIGAVVSIALAALWHGPLGAADRFTAEVEQVARRALVYNEIPEVSGHLHHGPLTRRILLSGPADDFQRRELVIVMDQVPGVESASWSQDGGGTPLIVEGALVALLGFLFGLLVAYLRDLRRRYNAQWKW
jgi:membrane protease YdiL (CAAX protease family)